MHFVSSGSIATVREARGTGDLDLLRSWSPAPAAASLQAWTAWKARRTGERRRRIFDGLVSACARCSLAAVWPVLLPEPGRSGVVGNEGRD